MLFELHITVPADTDMERWVRFCEGRGAKPLDIRLHNPTHSDEPANPRQIMFATTFEGSENQAYWWMQDWKKAVNDAGFPYERVKLEVPLDKSAGADVAYYESHVKALVYERDRHWALEAAGNDDWIASSNALYPKDEQQHKMYFTRRVTGDADWRSAGDELMKAFQHSSFAAYCYTVRMESEAVIHDSNPDLDKGWA